VTFTLLYDQRVPLGLAARDVWGLPAPPENVLAFIQTEVASVLFQIYPGSCLSLHDRHNRASVENKTAVHPVLT